MNYKSEMTAAEWRAAAEEYRRWAAVQDDELLAAEARKVAAHCNTLADRVEAEQARSYVQAAADRLTSGRCRADCVPCAAKRARRRTLVVLLYAVGFTVIAASYPVEGLLGGGLAVLGMALVAAGWAIRRGAAGTRPVFRGATGGN